MTENEARTLFNETICGHWENWPRGAEEVFVWVKALMTFDYAVARDAINELYASWDGKQYPKMAAIMAEVRKAAARRQQASPFVKRYQIENEEGKPVWKPFWAKANIARQELELEAERLCKEADRMFPRQKHITRWFNDDGGEDKGYSGPDAKEKAFAEILAGPDGGTKRFLMSYLERKKRSIQAKKIGQDDPVLVGTVIEDVVPF